jgi:hypothetical protein
LKGEVFEEMNMKRLSPMDEFLNYIAHTVAMEQVRHKLILKIKCQNFKKSIFFKKKFILEIKKSLGIFSEIGIYQTTNF